ncbi:MAG: NAD(+) diphosphatase [Rhodothalassiaceae bacterium]
MTDDLSRLAFCGNPLDRAEDRRNDAEFLARAHRDGLWLGLCDNRVLMRVDGSRLVPAWMSADAIPDGCESVFLGIAPDGRARLAAALPGDFDPGAAMPVDARSIAMQLASGGDDGTTGIVAQALALLGWHHRHGFCARCGAATRARRAGYQRRCEACGTEHFPRTDPVAIMLVVRGDRCLLARQPHFPPAMWSALAGFVEAGESLEAAVRRETHEETGIRVGAMRYVGSQPWPFPANLMLGFIAEAETEALSIDHNELEDARWFARADVAAALEGTRSGLIPPPAIAIARRLLEIWLADADREP